MLCIIYIVYNTVYSFYSRRSIDWESVCCCCCCCCLSHCIRHLFRLMCTCTTYFTHVFVHCPHCCCILKHIFAIRLIPQQHIPLQVYATVQTLYIPPIFWGMDQHQFSVTNVTRWFYAGCIWGPAKKTTT